MATDLQFNDVIRTDLACYHAGQLGLNVRYYLCNSVPGLVVPTDASLAVALDDNLAPLYKACLGTDASWYGVRAQIVSRVIMPVAVVSAKNIGAGTGGAQSVPGQVAPVITLRSNRAGRWGRGRVYVPFVSEVMVEPVVAAVTDTGKELLDALALELTQTISYGEGENQVNLVPILYSPVVNTRIAIETAAASGRFGTQRSRGNYGRTNPYPPFGGAAIIPE